MNQFLEGHGQGRTRDGNYVTLGIGIPCYNFGEIVGFFVYEQRGEFAVQVFKHREFK